MLDGLTDLLFFGLVILQRTSLVFFGFIKNDWSFRLLRYLILHLDFTRLSSIFSAIEVQRLLKLFAILVGLFILLLPTWMQLISLLPLVVMLIIFL